MKKIIFIMTIFLISKYSFAFTHCPSVNQIKNNLLGYWLPLYRNNEELINDIDFVRFKRDISEFNYAEWNTDYLESAHCYYSGSALVGKITLAMDAWRPEWNDHWRWVEENKKAVCLSKNVEHCAFIR